MLCVVCMCMCLHIQISPRACSSGGVRECSSGGVRACVRDYYCTMLSPANCVARAREESFQLQGSPELEILSGVLRLLRA